MVLQDPRDGPWDNVPMGIFDTFYRSEDDDTEYQTKATGQRNTSFRVGDGVEVHPWNPRDSDEPVGDPLPVADFAVAALAVDRWFWAIVRDGRFTGLLSPELDYPAGLPLFGFYGQAHTAGVPLDSRTLGRGRHLN